MRTLLVSLLLVFAACVEPEVQYAATSPTPDLVEVSPGVRVIADYDESIFFADGFYWWFYGDTWYRSTTYTGGWIWVATPPVVIARIQTPHVYRHYRPTQWAPRHRPMPAHRIHRPRVRDHRR